jgi:hypothetical protein
VKNSKRAEWSYATCYEYLELMNLMLMMKTKQAAKWPDFDPNKRNALRKKIMGTLEKKREFTIKIGQQEPNECWEEEFQKTVVMKK